MAYLTGRGVGMPLQRASSEILELTVNAPALLKKLGSSSPVSHCMPHALAAIQYWAPHLWW
jgi:hypothetical protein